MKYSDLQAATKIGHWLLISEVRQHGQPVKWLCRCDCGTEKVVYGSNLIQGVSQSCGKCGRSENRYVDCSDGVSTAVHVNNEYVFFIDKSDKDKVRQQQWYVSWCAPGLPQIITAKSTHLHRFLMGEPEGHEVDHIDRDRMNNRRSNLRVCTHRQNQCNQGLQRNNPSGYAGVRYYAPRGKYSARIKLYQHEVHLGYYPDIMIAAQVRNAAQWFLFGEYGVYPDVGSAPEFMLAYIMSQCARGISKLGPLLPQDELQGILLRMGVPDVLEIERNVANPYDGVGILFNAKEA